MRGWEHQIRASGYHPREALARMVLAVRGNGTPLILPDGRLIIFTRHGNLNRASEYLSLQSECCLSRNLISREEWSDLLFRFSKLVKIIDYLSN